MLKRKTNIFVTILFTFVAFMLIGTTNVNASEPILVENESELIAAVDKRNSSDAIEETTYVKLCNNIGINSTLIITPINDLILDLNGYELKQNDLNVNIIIYYGVKDTTEGSLTIKDSSETKTGKIRVYKRIEIRDYNTNTVDKHFTLNIEGGKFVHSEGNKMFYLYDDTNYNSTYKSTYDFNVKGGYFEIKGDDAIFVDATNLEYYNIALNLKLHKLTVKANNTRFIYTNKEKAADFTVEDVLAADSKFTVKNSGTSESGILNIIIDKNVSVATYGAIKERVGFYFDTIEITKPWAWSVSDVTYTETVGYNTAQSVSIPICNIGEDTNSILSVTVDSDNFIIEEGSKTGINSGDTDTSWKIKAKPGLAKGTYTATITLTNSVGVQYKATVTLTVEAKNLGKLKITVSKQISYGDTYEPKLTNAITGNTISSDVYKFMYTTKVGNSYAPATATKPTKLGSYIVTIKLTDSDYSITGDYPSAAFTIVAKKIEPTVSEIPDQTYTGGQIIPEVSVTYNGTALTKDVDYKATSGGLNQEVGEGKITVKPVSGSNYTFDNIEKTFKIVARSLKADDISVTLTPTSFEYTGDEIKPAPFVKHGGKTLTKDTDYELSYSNNTAIGDTATVTVTGKGNYTGTVTKNFSITSATTTDKKRQVIVFVDDSITKTYGDSNFTEPVNQTLGDGIITYESTNPDVATVDETTGEVTILKAGTTTIKAKASETDEYKSAENQYELTVNKKDLSFTATINDKEYDGTTTATLDSIEFIGLVGSETLTEGIDYEVTEIMFLGVQDAGNDLSTTVTIALKGTAGANNYKLAPNCYEGAKANITPKAIEASWITVEPSTSYTYNGSEIKPSITVFYGAITLTENTDYTVEYLNNTNAGIGKIKVIGMGNYSGDAEKGFTINPKEVSLTVVDIANQTYTGEQITPAVSVSCDSATLEEDTDYTVEYGENKTVGTGTATVKPVDGSNYTFTDIEKTFSIVAKTLEESNVTLAPISYTHTGNAIKPVPDVKVGDTTLVAGTDYELSYSNNTNIGENTATVTVTGKGNYTGEVTKTFSIVEKSSQTINFAETSITKIYGDDKFAITANHTTGDGTVTYTSTNTDVATVNETTGEVTILKVGTTKIKATASETANYTEATDKYTLTVNKKELSYTATVNDKEFNYITAATVSGITFNGLVGTDTLAKDTDYTVTADFANESAGENKDVNVTITLQDTEAANNYVLTSANYTAKANITPKLIEATWITVDETAPYIYTGSAIEPSITVKDGGTLLERDAFYTVEYVNNVNAGTGTIKVTAKDNYKGTVEKEFTINKKSITPTIEDIPAVTYNGSNHTPELVVKDGTTTLEKDKDYTVEYTNNLNAGEADAGITAVSTSNYTFTTTGKSFTINKYEIKESDVTLEYTSVKADGTAKKPTVTVKMGGTVIDPLKYNVSYANNTSAGEASVTVAMIESDTNNFTGSVTVHFNIVGKTTGGGGGGSSTTTYAITVKENENAEVTPNGTVKVEKGSDKTFKIKAKEGYEIEDVLVDGKSVGAVSKYTFENVKAKHTLEVKVKKAEEKPTTPEVKETFKDVKKGDWYFEAVEYVAKKGLMNGTGNDMFSPDATTTRGMIVTILYRLEGEPAVEECSFTDVPSNAYYAKAIAWAEKNGIVLGLGEGKFGPDQEITREQLATIMYRYSMYKKYDTSVAEDTNILSYNDIQDLAEYAFQAMQYACGEGLISGMGNGNLNPKGNATRAQVATILMRYCEKYMK